MVNRETLRSCATWTTDKSRSSKIVVSSICDCEGAEPVRFAPFRGARERGEGIIAFDIVIKQGGNRERRRALVAK